jgi:ElaB/YqjD/DUF883 family membrane-anchored ribosome-binding protein
MDNIPKSAAQLGESISKKAESLEQAALDAAEALRRESQNAACCASAYIRKNPLPMVAGAFAFGIAVGYLIVSGRHTPTFRERYLREPLDHANEALSDTFHRLAGNLKFW